jgi:hypothetical protein
MKIRKSCCLAVLLCLCGGAALQAQMDPYFTAINYPLPKDTMMFMVLPDFQVARYTRNFFTAMGMVQYGVTSRWTVGFMAEGNKILGLPVTYGGLRLSSSFRVFPKDRILNFTVYGEFEDLNEAGLYKMEVAGFGGADLAGPLAAARRTPARTFEQRAIVYHDWGRTNLTFNFISETGLSRPGNDFGYVLGTFRQPAWTGMAGMTGMASMTGMSDPPALSPQRLGFGLEMIGALGNNRQFGFGWTRQQQYLGPVFGYTLSRNWTARMEPAFGLSGVSDPFVLRMGVMYSIDHFAHRLANAF